MTLYEVELADTVPINVQLDDPFGDSSIRKLVSSLELSCQLKLICVCNTTVAVRFVGADSVLNVVALAVLL